MKLIIETVIIENIADAESHPQWAEFQRRIYIVEQVTKGQAIRIIRDGIPTLREFIEYATPYEEELIQDYYVVNDEPDFPNPDRKDQPKWRSQQVNLRYYSGGWHAQFAWACQEPEF